MCYANEKEIKTQVVVKNYYIEFVDKKFHLGEKCFKQNYIKNKIIIICGESVLENMCFGEHSD